MTEQSLEFKSGLEWASPLDDTSRKEVFLLPKDLALFIFHIFIEGIFQRELSFFYELTLVTLCFSELLLHYYYISMQKDFNYGFFFLKN